MKSELLEKTIPEINSLFKRGEISPLELLEEVEKQVIQDEPKIDTFITQTFDKAKEKASKISEYDMLSGIPVSIKDTFTTKDIKTTAASKMLEDFIPPYNATAYERLDEMGSLTIGKTNMDEFAHGFTTEYSAFKTTKNPWNLNKVPGGSSGGSAAAVAARMGFLSLASENYGSIIEPASLCGVVGMKPTYGRSSRYGIIAMASSLECPGIMGKCIEDVAIGIEAISGWDEKDATTIDQPVENYYENLNQNIKGKKIAVIKSVYELVSKEIRESMDKAIEVYKSLGCEIEFINWYELDLDGFIYDVMYRSEVSSNLARYDGIRYGYQPDLNMQNIDEYYFEARDKFGSHVKRQITSDPIALTGKDDDVYELALKLRRKNRDHIDELLSKYDAILTPATAFISLNIGDIFDQHWRDENRGLSTISSSTKCPTALYGYPALTFPVNMVDGIPVGIQIFASRFREQKLFDLGYAFQEETKIKCLKPS